MSLLCCVPCASGASSGLTSGQVAGIAVVGALVAVALGVFGVLRCREAAAATDRGSSGSYRSLSGMQ